MGWEGERELWPIGAPFEGQLEGPPARGLRWTLPGEYLPEFPDPDDWRQAEPWLISRDSFGAVANETPEWIDPLGDPMRRGFHRRFARLADRLEQSRPAAFVKFADKYGWLGPRWDDHRTTLVPLRRTAGGRGPSEVLGEPLRVWNDEVFKAAALIRLWDLIRKRDVRRLSRLVLRTGSSISINCWYVDGDLVRDPPLDASAEDGQPRHLYVPWSSDEDWPDDAIDVAAVLLRWQVNKRLRGEVSPQFGLFPEDDRDLRFAPHSLRASIFLHLAHEMSGRRRGRVVCAHLGCNREFEPRREGHKFCSDACRSLDEYHRNRSPRKAALTVVDGNPDGNRRTDPGGRGTIRQTN
ncbi:MAG: hypothetical protein M3Q10_12225 [Chloroflexota bacterium]|nr:hypothetical protein [Chloroflexota bacterium]